MATNELYKSYKMFVLHKKRIINNSRNYKSLRVLSSLDKALRMANVMKDYKPVGVAGSIIRLKPDLRNILPYENNFSYSGSLEALNHLLILSKQINYEKNHAKIK